MSHSHLSRRDFLKLASLASLSMLNLPVTHPEKRQQILAQAQPPNILVLVFDALSAHNMSLYGYPRQTTPNLERLAQKATVFHRHYAAGNFTSPGAASLLTGVLPWTHRALSTRSQPLERFADENIFNWLPKVYRKFAYTQNVVAYALLHHFRHHIDVLPAVGDLAVYSASYADKLFYNDYYVASKAEELALKKEFEQPASLFLSLFDQLTLNQHSARIVKQYRADYPRGLVNCRVGNPGESCFTLEEAIDWTRDQALHTPQPFMGYVHVLPPHAPYNPRDDFSNYFQDGWGPPAKPKFLDGKGYKQNVINRYRLRYDQCIAHVDAEFGRLYAELEQLGVLENTILIVTSDHGELLERGIIGHGTSAMYAPVIHIPLIVFMPAQRARQDVYTSTSAIDIVPTLLKLAGGPLPASLEGELLPYLGTETATPDRSIYAVEAKRNPKLGPLRNASISLVKHPYELIAYMGYRDIPDGYELYDMDADPEQIRDLYVAGDPSSQSIVRELQERLLALKLPSQR